MNLIRLSKHQSKNVAAIAVAVAAAVAALAVVVNELIDQTLTAVAVMRWGCTISCGHAAMRCDAAVRWGCHAVGMHHCSSAVVGMHMECDFAHGVGFLEKELVVVVVVISN